MRKEGGEGRDRREGGRREMSTMKVMGLMVVAAAVEGEGGAGKKEEMEGTVEMEEEENCAKWKRVDWWWWKGERGQYR